MIRFTVVWHEDAQNQLADIWIRAVDRNAVSQAADAVDAYLATDASVKGIVVEGNLCELAVPPLRVLFGVSEPDRLVKIVDVESL
ncbi:MAG: hypothetical protein WD971_07545 [Pirellulales bacterium]